MSIFEIFNLTLDTVCVSLLKEGIGADVKHARVLTLEYEATLWQTGVLGIDTPKSLLQAVFFITEMHFCLGRGQEH